jgi:hypothetical protein
MLGYQAGSRTGVNNTPIAALSHSLQHKPREIEWAIKIDSHRFTPNVWLLFPNDAFMGGTETVVADQDLDWTQPLLGVCDRVRTALGSSEIRYRIVETRFCQFLLASRNAHHPGTA